MEKESNVTWWKVLLTIIGPPILFVPATIVLAGFWVVFNFAWSAMGISQPIGYLYSTAIISVVLFILYLMHHRSPNARIWLAPSVYCTVLLAVMSFSTLGLSNAYPFMRLVAVVLLVGLWAYVGWIIWTIFAEV
ncbi:MAG: hypothetical protein LLG44_11060 [Chloroflexi bacterium]|nr:hypothetical protein [Chloroflexota bacterium]